MKIRYQKKQLRITLIFGTLWFIFGIIQIFLLSSDEGDWINYLWMVLSLAYFGMYAYQHYNQYLTLENGFIKKGSPFAKKINLTEIRQIKHFAGDYILKTDNSQLEINIALIDPASLSELNMELKKLDVEWV
ncbi:hypothetical protein LX77_00315 [Gelidibacter algens]|jgi:hypothetical protein|uniref:PH (Pleckstrin Homology) domain-containing protein n=1 Tax=Gelidibacter algens TaxID=49280 RepID=A0A1A7R3B4_9FLAO|nr:hypothetical protein [Gelidibacter algens]OBX25998.1 hypothetical protein A9996_06695 [Gelidibacter algens]RAJ27741.1 hypothetical protein LX77_00315 [Gelidibacter algens]